jgi:hypothetical protein
MPECDYCGESLGDKDAYLSHLASEHEGELSAIDQRRVADHDDGGSGFPVGPVVLVGLLGLAGGLVIWVTFFMGVGGGNGGAPPAEGEAAREIPDDPLLSDAESFPSNGRDHVSVGTEIEYDRTPPLSGTHYSNWEGAGFYEETPPLGGLVHSLEHGYVVIYYDPAELTPETRQELEGLATTYTDRWESVIVAPHPREDPESAYVLTAWQVKLRMDEYDPEKVDAFLDAFRGRGPENSVR